MPAMRILQQSSHPAISGLAGDRALSIKTTPVRAAVLTLLLGLVFLVLPVFTASAMTIQEVKSEKGITAWLVEDYTVPIVSLRFAFQGGSSQDPAGKEGTANLMSGLFDEGAGDLDSDTFQTRLDTAGAEMRFEATRDGVYGSMRMLAEKRDDALGLLKLAITSPRFDAAPIERIRAQVLSGLLAGERDPENIAQTKWRRSIYGSHPYANADDGTKETVPAITADDLRAFHKATFARDGLRVAVVGAIDAETLKRKLDELFGDLPEKQALKPVADVDLKFGQKVEVNYDLPQTSLQLAFPGVRRDAPDFYAAAVMNDMLGGSAYTSRLYQEVREKRGLAYGVSSSLVNRRYAALLTVGTATRSDRAAETLGVVRDVIRRMATEGPTEQELAATKKYLIGAYAINNLDSSDAIANTLVELQVGELGIDYIQRRASYINAVTLDEVKAVARKLLSVEPSVLIVGPPLAGDGKG